MDHSTQSCTCCSQPYRKSAPVPDYLLLADAGDMKNMEPQLILEMQKANELPRVDQTTAAKIVRKAETEIKSITLEPQHNVARFSLDEIAAGP
eukprot:CAMPEP_0116542176 /NCGR_PEP_ID=MMETSP0397-20121206/876_1 /TAXON_ID=216820 /ORGANISM="Cyclophora tenuis, Strain ECT3854" /LENGTH=92 /DNA_ID=CAMNT_0004066167 /DNA_START=939 /DNA_END=1213 /DNA_ORIENTATION=+